MTFKTFINPVNSYLFKVNNGNTRKRYEIYSKLTIKTPERRNWRDLISLLLTLNILHTLFLVLLLMTLNRSFLARKPFPRRQEEIQVGLLLPLWKFLFTVSEIQWFYVHNTHITPNFSTVSSASLVKTHMQRTGYKIFFSMIHIHTYNFSNHVISDGSNKNNAGEIWLSLPDRIQLN